MQIMIKMIWETAIIIEPFEVFLSIFGTASWLRWNMIRNSF